MQPTKPTNGRHPPLPEIEPLNLSPLEERLTLEGYRSLIADHCQTVDRLAHLTQFTVALWDSLQQVRSRLQEQGLDLPHLPLPIAASLAVAARPVAPMPCDQPDPAGAFAAIDELIRRMSAMPAHDKPSYQHTQCAHTQES